MIVLPIRTDCPPKHTPTMNYALIAINLVVFVTLRYMLPENLAEGIATLTMLDCADPKLWQFITYAFRHADWSHILGNMFFLYIFGNSLNDKFGHVRYLLFYLASAVFVGAAYALFKSNALVGASGAIAAVTTGYLVLFPRSRILLLFAFIFITTFEVSSLFLIAFKMVLFDNIIMPQVDGPGRVAYEAHLFGYLFGFVVPLGMLAIHALPRDDFDILALWSRMMRRREFRRSVNASGTSPWSGVPQARPVRASVRDVPVDAERAAKFAELRSAISEALRRYDLATAAEAYLVLIDLDATQTLDPQPQLDIANQLMSSGRYPQAAEAYEKYLTRYPNGDQKPQVQLLLGIICARHTAQPERAKELLLAAQSRVTDPAQQRLCEAELGKLASGF